MANTIGWGQGASNNTIGWGQGDNNAIGWGSIHFTSYSGETDITGFVGFSVNNFQSRVIADSGTFEAKQCEINQLLSIWVY